MCGSVVCEGRGASLAKRHLTAALLCALSLAGCSPVRYFRVESDPPGARVVGPDNTLACAAPCLTTCTVGATNQGPSGQPSAYTIKALPARAQDCVQTTNFSCDGMSADPSTTRTIFFDMKVCPINRSLNGTMDGN